MNKRMKKKRALEERVRSLESHLDFALYEIGRQDKEIEELKQISSRNAQATNSRFDYLEKKVADKVSKKSWFDRKQGGGPHLDWQEETATKSHNQTVWNPCGFLISKNRKERKMVDIRIGKGYIEVDGKNVARGCVGYEVKEETPGDTKVILDFNAKSVKIDR